MMRQPCDAAQQHLMDALSLSGAFDARKTGADAREQPLCCDRAGVDRSDEAASVDESDQMAV